MIFVPAGSDHIIICHWTEGGFWEALNVPHQALGGHDNHDYDVWPNIEGVTPGQNWPDGEEMYLNDCALTASATPSPEPSETLPPTGGSLNMALVGVLLIGAGAWLKLRTMRTG